MSRRQFGSIRKLPSGRYQASYWHADGHFVAPDTFSSKKDANSWLAIVESDIARRGWIDPRSGRMTVAEYGSKWLDQRYDLRPRTIELYEHLLRVHILPALGEVELGELTTGVVREWYVHVVRSKRPTTAAKCYRLLRAILSTAVEDGYIVANPCTIKGAGVEHHKERPVATVEQVERLADAIEPRYRAMVLLACWCGLRLGELMALTRERVDLLHGLVEISESVAELKDGKRIVGPPKTEAGKRIVAIPPHIIGDLEHHLTDYVASAPSTPLFSGPKGAPIRRPNFAKVWDEARRAVGMPDFHFHDLRHTGNTFAASTGASTKELMARMGHASPRAALIYQHATAQRDRAIADALTELAIAEGHAPKARVTNLRSGGKDSRNRRSS